MRKARRLSSSLVLISSAAVGVGSVVAVQSLDRTAEQVLGSLRGPLERSLSTALGHPFTLGSYQGLRPWGVALGETTIAPISSDRSTIKVQGLSVHLAPLASLRQWQPVLRLKLQGLTGALDRQPDGRYWQFGEVPQGGDAPPDLDLRFELDQPARIRLTPSGEQLQLTSRGSVQIARKRFTAFSKLHWPGRAGSLDLEAKGGWGRPELVLTSRLRSLDLARLEPLLPAPDATDLSGQAGGELAIQWTPGRFRCQGQLQIKDLELRNTTLPEPLRSSAVGLRCRDDRLSLDRSRFRLGEWRADARGSVQRHGPVDLRINVVSSQRKDRVQLQLDGPWSNPRWNLAGVLSLPELDGPLRLQGQLRTPWIDPGTRQIQVQTAQLTAPGLRLRLDGTIGEQIDLRSRELSLAPSLWQRWPALKQTLGETSAISGTLRASGPLASPELALDLAQERNLLLQQWDLRASWSKATGVVALDRFNSPVLRAAAQLPVRWQDGAAQPGELKAGFALTSLPLARLSALAALPLNGQLSARGRLQGPLKDLNSTVALDLLRPGAGPLQLPERWQGQLTGTSGSAFDLRLASQAAGSDGSLTARLGASGWPLQADLRRGGGRLTVRSDARRQLRWKADQLSIDGLQLTLPTTSSSGSLQGRLSGDGALALTPLELVGSLDLDDPQLRGIGLNRIELEGRVSAGRFQARGRLQPQQGEIQLTAQGRVGADLRSRIVASGLDVPWLVQMTRQLRDGQPAVAGITGRAEDLGTLMIETFGGSLDGHLRALRQSRLWLEAYDRDHPQARVDPGDLRGRLDAVLNLAGPDLASLSLEAEARAHLWLDGDDQDRVLQLEPVVAQLSGPLQGGQGRFSLLHLPFSLLALVVPVPSVLRGAIGATGSYDLTGRGPLLTTELALEQARFGAQALRLERRAVVLSSDGLELDLALRSDGAAEALKVRGRIPLTLRDALDLELEGHGDALSFLAASAGDALTLTRGSSDLRLMLSGYLDQPQANGFLVVRDGAFTAAEQAFNNVNASLLFDFNRVEVSQLEATLGSGGSLSAAGAIGLFIPRDEETPLSIRLTKATIRQDMVDLAADAEITLRGSLSQPLISGQLNLRNGVIQPRSGLLSRLRKGGGSSLQQGVQPSQGNGSTPFSTAALLEDSWDFQDPLVLFGPGAPAQLPAAFQALMPDLSAVRFRNFRLGLGPDLQVRMPPLISFRGGGQLLVNGPLDPSLQLRGLIRLNRGRINLFSSTFRLDSRAPNVAVFTPSLGLVPFVDIAMKTRVSDSVQPGTAGNAGTANVFDNNGLGSIGDGGGQLRLVKVTVDAAGPADRLIGNLDLRSVPPMSEPQLLALIGGNSLSGLAGAGGAALATVLGQSLLSPVLGTLTDALGQRLQIALFPTYVTPDVKDDDERRSGRVAPTFTLVTEIGVDVTDRFDFSVLAAPNTSDVPPQATVTYQVTPNTALSGSVDSNGTWQSQLQLFFRF